MIVSDDPNAPSAAADAPQLDITLPKFRIGDVVYLAGYRQEQMSVTCPDCHDTRTWIVETPAGERFKVPCARCAAGYGQLPGVKVTQFVPAPRALTIRSVEARSCPRGHNDEEQSPSVTYYDSANCCGTTAHERDVFTFLEEAREASVPLAAKAQQDWEARNQKQVKREKLRDYHIREALKREADIEREELRDKYSALLDEVCELPDNHYQLPNGSASEEQLKQAARFILTEAGEDIPEEWGDE